MARTASERKAPEPAPECTARPRRRVLGRGRGRRACLNDRQTPQQQRTRETLTRRASMARCEIFLLRAPLDDVVETTHPAGKIWVDTLQPPAGTEFALRAISVAVVWVSSMPEILRVKPVTQCLDAKSRD